MKTSRSFLWVLVTALTVSAAARCSSPNNAPRPKPPPSIFDLAPSNQPVAIVDAANADKLLKRGDVLIKRLGASTKATKTQLLIRSGQKVIRKLSGLFHRGIKRGDPRLYHVAVYVGRGRTAEAHGGNIRTARVGVRSLNYHAGYLFRVYRPRDRALAEAAARVAETWANGRMRYRVPVLTAFRNDDFGPRARRAALLYGKNAGRPGGPPSVRGMFCSQFAMAVYQAAQVARQLKTNPGLRARQVRMPPGLDLHPTSASPLAVHARLLHGVSRGTWKRVGEVIVRPQSTPAGPPVAAGPDVTRRLELLGNPTLKRYPIGQWVYARNPWSLVAYDGKIFIASGNSNNKPPGPNAGPVDLWTFNPASRKFAVDRVIQDEQVDVMRVIGRELFIPGHDSRVTGRNAKRLTKVSPKNLIKDWAAGNLYRRRPGGQWTRLRTIKNGIHVYDVLQFHNKLFAAIATLAGGKVARSADGGRSWHGMTTKPRPGQRTRSLFVLGGKLHASTTGGRVYRYDGHKRFVPLAVRFFPGAKETKSLFAARPTAFGGQVAYIGARKLIDHDWVPVGLFAAQTKSPPRAVPLPSGALPRDLLVNGSTLYILASTRPHPKRARVHVFATKNLKTFREVLRFSAPTFARSFARLGSTFYFGLGCDPDKLERATGRILRVKP